MQQYPKFGLGTYDKKCGDKLNPESKNRRAKSFFKLLECCGSSASFAAGTSLSLYLSRLRDVNNQGGVLIQSGSMCSVEIK